MLQAFDLQETCLRWQATVILYLACISKVHNSRSSGSVSLVSLAWLSDHVRQSSDEPDLREVKVICP